MKLGLELSPRDVRLTDQPAGLIGDIGVLVAWTAASAARGETAYKTGPCGCSQRLNSWVKTAIDPEKQTR